MKAIWNGTVLAESEDTVVVEGNHYFAKDSISTEYFQPKRIQFAGGKARASYYDVV